MKVFGEVAGDYDAVRPPYPASVAAALGTYLGRRPASITEIGAGTGLATATLRLLGAPMVCVEPDARMSAILQMNYPDATVVTEDFSSWTPPPGGVPVLAGAMVWHHLDAHSRCARAFAALSADGTLAIIGRGYGFADPAQAAAVSGVLERAWPTPMARDADWIRADVEASGLFRDVEASRHDTVASLTVEAYRRLVSTYSPFRLLAPHRRDEVLHALEAALAPTGGSVGVEMTTTLTLARRQA